MTLKTRIQQLLHHINRGIYEKETETALALLAAIAGESIILLGPPGVAKSMVARRLKLAFKDARSFEYLMSRFSTPDEIFGPVSISRLKTADEYMRSTAGYLPTADVVFLDEIWKAGPAIQNTLLTAVNERLFRNGNRETHIPLKLLIAASNELPAQGEGLEALWDRFVIRLECRNIRRESNFDLMILDGDSGMADDNAGQTNENIVNNAELSTLQISQEEYALWQKDLAKVAIGTDVLDCIHSIRRGIRSVGIEGMSERRDIYISDRRWKLIARLLRTSAYLQDRHQVALADLLPIYHCLWQEPEERDGVREIVVNSIFAGLSAKFADMKQALKEDIRRHRAASAARHISAEDAVPGLSASMHQRDYDSEIEELADCVRSLNSDIDSNIFVADDDKKAMREYLAPMNKEIAFTRQDIAKLYEY